MAKVALGIAGLGGGSRHIMSSFNDNPEVEFTAAADIDQDLLASFHEATGARVYDDFEDMCKDPEIDIVHIATPNWLHTQHALTALEHGKHVLVEKPMATNIEDADRIITAAAAVGREVIVDFPQGLHAPIRQLGSWTEGREFGPLQSVQTWHYGDWLYRPRSPEEIDPDPRNGSGVVFRQGSHQFGTIQAITRSPAKAVKAATVWANDSARPVAGSYVAYIEYESGCIVTASYSAYDRFKTDELVSDAELPYGAARAALSSDRTPDEEKAQKYGNVRAAPWFSGSRPAFMWISNGLTLASYERAEARLTPTGLVLYDDQARQPMDLPLTDTGQKAVVEQMCDLVLRGKTPSLSARWGKSMLEICLAVVQAGKSGQPVDLRHQHIG
jgi:phthalate 4,5-cis-dihydrodiol dehydrogenase